jgi:hypothetical protein
MCCRLTITLILVVGFGACASDEAEEAFTITDSAGVSIAVSHEPAWPDGGGWRLGGQPSVLIGGGITDTTVLEGPVAGAFRLDDGRLIVADEGSRQLRWYTETGTLLMSVGREGDGPGEFRDLSALLHVGDSVAVLDRELRRLSLFDLEGHFGRSITLKNPPEEAFPPRPIGRLASGEWIALVQGSHSTGELTRAVRDSVAIWLVSDAGEPVRRLAALPGDDRLVFASRDFVGETVPPYGRNTTIRFHDGQVWAGTGDEFRLDRWTTDGELEGSVRWARAPEPVLQATIDHVRDSVQAQFSDAESQWRAVGAEVLKGLDAWGTPARAPAYGSFRLDDDGNLWVAAYALENSIEPITWHVFDVNGRLLGDVVFPPAVVPSHITSDQIIGIWTDPDGLERVVAYPLLRDSTGM